MARLAGLPESVIARAREILANLEGGELDAEGQPRLARPGDRSAAAAQRSQLDLFGGAPEASPPLDVEAAGVLEELRAFDPERSTPIEALVALQRWVSRLRGEGAE